MTHEEAIEVLRWAINRLEGHHYIIDDNGTVDPSAKVNAFGMAIEALEKRMPRKPSLKREQTSPFGVDDVPYCPNCNCSVPWIETSVFYCESCGQAIEWSEGK